MIAVPRTKPAAQTKPQPRPRPKPKDKRLAEIKEVFYPRPEPCADPLGQRLWETFGHSTWDYIEADNSNPDQKPVWRTEDKYPLSPRVLWQRHQNPALLIGVRFDKATCYALLDIDTFSQYLNPESIRDIRFALETIGIVGTVLLRSSYSNGVHLYLPLPESVSTFDLAVCLHQTLATHGFEIEPGQLETFPNPKRYANGVSTFSRYNAHRLPLQPDSGSYLLDEDLNPVGNSLEQFWQQWDWASAQQDPNELGLMLSFCRDARRRQNRHRKPVDKANFNECRLERWRESLEALLAEGWSGPGQTNNLLKQITILGHVHHQLEGSELVEYIETTAPSLPGYRQHCGHQHELHRRAKSWAKHVEKVYWKAGSDPKARPIALECLSDDPELAEELAPLHPNYDRRQSAHERIRLAYADLQAQGPLPERIRDLAQLLRHQAQCSLTTLYSAHNRSLWHPEHRFEGSDQYDGSDQVEQVIDANPTPRPTGQPDRPPDQQPDLDQPDSALDQPVTSIDINETTPLQPSESGLEAIESRSPEPLQDGLLQADPPSMKYQGACNADLGSDSDSRENQSSGNGGARGGDESSFPQAESPVPEDDDDLEQRLMALHQEMVESGQVDGGQVESDLGNGAQPAPVTTSTSQPDPEPRTNTQPSASVPVATPDPSPPAPASGPSPQDLPSQPRTRSPQDILATEFQSAAAPMSEATAKPKPKPKLKTKVKSTSSPAPVPSRQPKLTKRQQAQAKEQVEVIIPGIQRCVAQLGWNGEQTAKFIQTRFNGRRRAELSHDELVLLLYRLQTELLEQSSDST